MNDESDNEVTPKPVAGASAASLDDRPSEPPRPPAKPVNRPVSVPSPARPISKLPLPRQSRPPPAVEPAQQRPPPSIKPMQMIKLGTSKPPSEPPPSALDRLSSRPPPPPKVATFDPPTIPLAEGEILTEPATSSPSPPPPSPPGFDPPTIQDYEEDEPEPITPPRAVSQPAQRRSPPPPPSSLRPSRDSAPDIEVDVGDVARADLPPDLPPVDAEEVPDSDIAPDSDEIPVSEEPVSDEVEERVSVELAEADATAPEGARGDDGLREDKRKPPPPPKRGAGPSKAPSEKAVAQALEAPRFEAASAKPRAKPWWEDLFTDDFARGILPLSATQVRREVDFIEESLGVAKGGVVLDLACGTGHHAVELSSRGYGVVGFDLSVPQLASAGEHAQERGQKMNFLQGDMRDMSFDEVFDGIYCWNTSFGYFEEDKNVAVAQRVFNALRPGGSFLLDVANRDFVAEHQPSQVWFEGDACVCMDDMSVDFITSRLRVKRTMMLDDGRTRECTYSIRIYSLHELGKLLHDIGFRVTEASGHTAYPGVFFGATSPRVVILAQKP